MTMFHFLLTIKIEKSPPVQKNISYNKFLVEKGFLPKYNNKKKRNNYFRESQTE